ncbi:hypothetical protein QBC33DRAFT_313551 [Phialemonium atrogriseum]|uniref:DNA (cytosine-5-)-methyltransferase n=1 Tax=Phialemonium atrogriseum TaxID=1093897 RepID=A0AAJ0C9I1_9PEZI|nr:uncharacterized protein QBC33DRAFT_313551 [Phialemonium atrogriseum]KAK1770181.1 hypothetical protein QBC33DRAFT_313551 [Phialemonium atrogriseum]
MPSVSAPVILRVVESAHLTATKYSLLKSEPLFRDLTSPVGEDMAAGDRIELLLHFTLPESLGTRHDSEVIKIDDIIEVCRFPRNFEVVHCVQPPPDAVESRTPFCRFAHSVIDEAITVMPLASELLPRRDRIRQDSFAEVSVLSVVDLTPNVLGPLEGFTDIADMGYRVLAGVGFKEDRHSTWRVRYPECKIFDESPQGIFGDFASGKLVPPGLPPPGNPMIALVAGENTNFRLSQGNKDMPSVDLFLSPLGIMDSATSSHFKPDFTALQISPAVLHSSTIRRFSESILRLLEQGQTVRISLQSLQAHGIPQDRSILVVVGSPFPGSAHVSTKRHDPPAIATGATRSQSPGKIEAFIGDLAFENPRATEGAGGTFVCSQADGAGMPPRYIYNHGTGQHVPGEDAKAVDMDADTVVLSYNSSQSLIHPVRRDLLTVRELARLQGFKDDFVFYGSPESQRKDVLAAQPPAVAKAIAKTILGVVMLSRKVELGDGGGNSRANKRPRVETD